MVNELLFDYLKEPLEKHRSRTLCSSNPLVSCCGEGSPPGSGMQAAEALPRASGSGPAAEAIPSEAAL